MFGEEFTHLLTKALQNWLPIGQSEQSKKQGHENVQVSTMIGAEKHTRTHIHTKAQNTKPQFLHKFLASRNILGIQEHVLTHFRIAKYAFFLLNFFKNLLMIHLKYI